MELRYDLPAAVQNAAKPPAGLFRRSFSLYLEAGLTVGRMNGVQVLARVENFELSIPLTELILTVPKASLKATINLTPNAPGLPAVELSAPGAVTLWRESLPPSAKLQFSLPKLVVNPMKPEDTSIEARLAQAINLQWFIALFSGFVSQHTFLKTTGISEAVRIVCVDSRCKALTISWRSTSSSVCFASTWLERCKSSAGTRKSK